MVQLVRSYNYSQSNIYGWLLGRADALPSYAALVQVTQLPTVAARLQGLQRWSLFTTASLDKQEWPTNILENEYLAVLESLHTTDSPNQTYLADYIWLQISMPLIRQMSRHFFLEQELDENKSLISPLQQTKFLQELLEKIEQERSIPTSIWTHFVKAFETPLVGQMTLHSIESLLDKICMLIHMSHLTKRESKGVRTWILLSLLLEWSKQVLRHSKAGLPVPVWHEWFPAEIIESFPNVCANFEDIQSALWSSLNGGLEWYVPVELFDSAYLQTVDPLVFEHQTKVVSYTLLKQSLYSLDMSVELLTYLYKIRLVVETAATITANSVPSAEVVMELTCNYDA